MPVIINHKICSNMKFCDVLRVCPTGAVYWNDGAKRLEIDNSKCVSCGLCMKACPLVAIKVYKTQLELDKLKAEIDADPHSAEDLLVDRYGAGALETKPLLPNRVGKFIAEHDGLVCIELNPDDEKLVCNVQAIPISAIMDLDKVTYRACENGKEIAARYGVLELPALVFFKDGRRIGKIEGFFFDDSAERDVLIRKVQRILESH